MSIDYSIESALPYTESLDELSENFAVAYKGLTNKLEDENKRFARVLLVDDVTNDGGDGYNLDDYAAASTISGPDTLVMRESMLNGLADSVFTEMHARLSSIEADEIKGESGYSSPFYIAVWTLLRLGYLSHPDFPPDNVSDRIINILPERFREGEEKSLALVRKSQFPEAADKVDYTFIPDRPQGR